MRLEDFPILKNNIIYFDNGATTFKPQKVIDKINEYYKEYTSNAHRGDYDYSLKVDTEYENVRVKIKDFINAKQKEEIVFTSGTTHSLNQVIFGYCSKILKEGDEVLISKAEHASNVLPWMILSEKIGFNIKYIPLDSNYEINIEDVKKSITDKTKIISLAHVSNVIGDIRPIKEIGSICKERNILFIVDAAQSIGHLKIDVEDMNIDFLAASAHKMLGPTGTGFLYGKMDYLKETDPLMYGGGMNSYFESDFTYELKNVPLKFEAGTQNIAGVLGMGAAIDYLKEIGLDKIHEYEYELKKYAVSKLKEVPNIIIYNEKSKSGCLTFNIDKVFSQDTAVFLNNYNICVRSGNHCAKILKDEIGATNTCRAIFYLYNTKEEIDKFVEVLKMQDKIYDNIV
ncbi:MAG: cysteine desulfurase [Bacilli bacterium]|nr:cysteine desulfurase [Bacilli bacterium]